MSLDASTLPFSPFLLVAVAAYAGISATITGPEILSRELQRDRWPEICEQRLVQGARPSMPQFPDLGSLCGMLPGAEDLCAVLPDPAAIMRATTAAQISQSVSDAPSACSCAEQVFVRENRLAVATYAASGRTISMPALKDRDGGMSRALQSPDCKIGG